MKRVIRDRIPTQSSGITFHLCDPIVAHDTEDGKRTSDLNKWPCPCTDTNIFGDHVFVFVSAFEITYPRTDTSTDIFEITCPCSCPLLKSRIRERIRTRTSQILRIAQRTRIRTSCFFYVTDTDTLQIPCPCPCDGHVSVSVSSPRIVTRVEVVFQWNAFPSKFLLAKVRKYTGLVVRGCVLTDRHGPYVHLLESSFH